MRVHQVQRADWKVVRRLASDIFGFAPRTALLALMLVMAGAGVEAVAFVLLSPLLTLAQGAAAGQHSGAAMPRWWPGWADDGAHALLPLLALITLALLLRQVIVNRRQAVLSKLEIGYFVARQTELIAALAAAPWPTLAQLRHARITHLMTNDIHRMGMAAVGLLQSLTAIITLAIMLVAAMVLNAPLTMLSLLFAAVVIGLSGSLLAAAQTAAEEVTGANLTAIGSTGQFLGAIKSAIAENLEKQFVAEFAANRQEVVDAELAFVRRQGRSRLVISSASLLTAAAVTAIGFAGFGLAPATLIALLALLSRMTGPVGQLQSQLTELVRAVPAYRHVLALHEELTVQAPGSDRMGLPAAFREIAFQAVSYRHRGLAVDVGIAGVAGVDLTIRAGEFLGIAGPSGSGKTTFADLLVGLVDPDHGTICLNGAPISLREARWWRDRIAYIPQDPFLRHASIRDNLRSLTPGATDDEIFAILEFVGAQRLLRQLPDGLDTLVGERGSLVSGGERQRLALARALLRQPQLLLLDEATNALDQQSEEDLLSRLAETRAGRTTILITHRLSSLKHCDRIAVFRSGNLAIAPDVDKAARLLRAGYDGNDIGSSINGSSVA